MNNLNLLFKDSIKATHTNNKSLKKLSEKFNKIFPEIVREIKDVNKTLNVLDNNFKFNFKVKDLKKFKKFNNVILIGMGGSILGAEAIYNFFELKTK